MWWCVYMCDGVYMCGVVCIYVRWCVYMCVCVYANGCLCVSVDVWVWMGVGMYMCVYHSDEVDSCYSDSAHVQNGIVNIESQ